MISLDADCKFWMHGCEERDRLLVQGAFIALRGSDNLAPKPNCDTSALCHVAVGHIDVIGTYCH